MHMHYINAYIQKLISMQIFNYLSRRFYVPSTIYVHISINYVRCTVQIVRYIIVQIPLSIKMFYIQISIDMFIVYVYVIYCNHQDNVFVDKQGVLQFPGGI